MSMGPLGGVLGSAAGAPLSQTKGASTERAAREAAQQEVTDEVDLRAERSAGVGQTDSDEGTSDRDADGRRLWERPQERQGQAEEEEHDADPGASTHPDDSGEHRLDLLA